MACLNKGGALKGLHVDPYDIHVTIFGGSGNSSLEAGDSSEMSQCICE